MISLENLDAQKFTIANFGHPVSRRVNSQVIVKTINDTDNIS